MIHNLFIELEKYICTKRRQLWVFSHFFLVFSFSAFCLFRLFCLAFGCLDTDWALNGLPRVTDYPPLAPICYSTIVSRILTLPNTNDTNNTNAHNANPTNTLPWHQSAIVQLYHQVSNQPNHQGYYNYHILIIVLNTQNANPSIIIPWHQSAVQLNHQEIWAKA